MCLIVAVIGGAFAIVAVQYYHPETVTVTTDIHEYLNGEIIANNTTFDWGEVEAGFTYDWNYSVHNVGTITYMVSRTVHGLLGGWNETWTKNNNVLAPNQWLNGTLTLTIPANASGTYKWYSYLIGE